MVSTRHTESALATAKTAVTSVGSPYSGIGKRKALVVTALPRRIQKYAPKSNSTKFRKTKSTDDETVQVVKMLTGILYLYRGRGGARAEFVRKV